MLRPNDMDGIEKKIEGVMNGSQTFAIIRNGEDGRVPIFLSYKDDGKTILVITIGGPITGYQDSLAEIQFRGRQLVEFPAAIAWMKSRIAVNNVTPKRYVLDYAVSSSRRRITKPLR
ncbi:MAG: hypothetical protein DRQ65_02840 [Gammaproteobacteria bacterium]|nr:MAG: hypothetical protein DRQ65_02840 [Gammaproteobacteria bacterium]